MAAELSRCIMSEEMSAQDGISLRPRRPYGKQSHNSAKTVKLLFHYRDSCLRLHKRASSRPTECPTRHKHAEVT
jgi:hypothetical protein